MIEALSKIGVKEIILGINCQSKSRISAEVSATLLRNSIKISNNKGRQFLLMLRQQS
jgi:hypothetical protein